MRHRAGGDEHQRFVQGGGFDAGVKNHLDHVENVGRQLAAANRILGREFQQGWVSEVIPTLENNALPHQIRMLVQVGAQAGHVALIEKVDGAAKYGVFNSLVVRQIQII